MRNNPDTKVSEEGGGDSAPSAGAEIPLKPMEKTAMEQAVPLLPTEGHTGADIHGVSPWRTQHQSRLICPEGSYSLWRESPCRSRHLAGLVAHEEEPTLEQVLKSGIP